MNKQKQHKNKLKYFLFRFFFLGLQRIMTTTLTPSDKLIALRNNYAIKNRRNFLKHHASKQGLQIKQKEDTLDKHYRYND